MGYQGVDWIVFLMVGWLVSWLVGLMFSWLNGCLIGLGLIFFDTFFMLIQSLNSYGTCYSRF